MDSNQITSTNQSTSNGQTTNNNEGNSQNQTDNSNAPADQPTSSNATAAEVLLRICCSFPVQCVTPIYLDPSEQFVDALWLNPNEFFCSATELWRTFCLVSTCRNVGLGEDWDYDASRVRFMHTSFFFSFLSLSSLANDFFHEDGRPTAKIDVNVREEYEALK